MTGTPELSIGAGHTAESIIVSEVNPSSARDQGERSLVVGSNAQDTPVAGVSNPLGDSGEAHPVSDDSDESPLNVADILERFDSNTRVRFKPGSKTRTDYQRIFRRFAKDANLPSYSRRQLASPKGRDLILRHMERIPLRSRRVVLAALQCVWEEGIRLPWPVNTKRDFGKTLPPIGSRHTPPDSDIRRWLEAVSYEKDAYVRVLVLCTLQFGWRPENQLGHLKRRNLRFDTTGKPVAFVADGTDESFKTHSPIIAWIPPDVADALGAWLPVSPVQSPEGRILPWRGSTGNFQVDKTLEKTGIHRLWRNFEKKHGLAHLPPVYFRHWVKTACRRAGMSDPAMAAWQGHEPPKDGSMRNQYDKPGEEAILDEQAQCLPHGPLGLLKPPEVKVTDGLSEAGVSLLRQFEAGEIGSFELAQRLEASKRKRSSKFVVEP